MIKTIYFDLGNVLIFFSFPKMLEQIATLSGLKGSDIEKIFFQTDLRKLYETGKIQTRDLYQALLSHSSKPFTQKAFEWAFSNIFTPNLELWPLVSQLKEKGVRLILLSNTSECHFHFAQEHYPILKQFDELILSYEVGAWKPEAEIFQTALQRAHCKAEECFYTDDVPEFIQAAQESGLNGEVFTTTEQLKQALSRRGCPLL